jgi:hypothetical protein
MVCQPERVGGVRNQFTKRSGLRQTKLRLCHVSVYARSGLGSMAQSAIHTTSGDLPHSPNQHSECLHLRLFGTGSMYVL